jgi:hypothetical protein
MLKIQIETSNAAFEEPGEVARILRELADKLDGATNEGGMINNQPIRDINGNRVGSWDWER